VFARPKNSIYGAAMKEVARIFETATPAGSELWLLP